MPQSLSLNIDPAQVLGVRPDATLQEIRDAYRLKVKRHHPDQGGEDWAFRILVQSYEMMSTARVAQAAARPEPPRRPRAPTPPPPGPGFNFQGTPPPRPGPEPTARLRPTQATTGETVREGVADAASDPSRVVDVEKLALKHQVDHIWLVTEHSSDDRFLSCSLNLTWPSAGFASPPAEVPDHEKILADLQAVFQEVAELTRSTSADCTVVDGRFNGWLSYPGPDPAAEAYDRLHRRLNKLGLAVKPWSRDVLIPRDRR